METREIHLDCQEIGSSDRAGLLALGFYEDHFVRAGGGLALPPFHLTWEISGPRSEVISSHKRVLDRTIALAEVSSVFVGYIEAEIIIPAFHAELPGRIFSPVIGFPLPKTQQIVTCRNKVGDLHIKVPIATMSSELERIMEKAGIYFVETAKRNRIYTLQFLEHAEGRITFSRIVEYFRSCGGATEVTYEVCSLFRRRPKSLEAPSVVEPGTLLRYFRSCIRSEL